VARSSGPTTAAAETVEHVLPVHILPVFGRRPMASIRTSEIQAWVAGLELRPTTVAAAYGKLAAILAAAVQDRVIARSPCTRRVKLPRADEAALIFSDGKGDPIRRNALGHIWRRAATKANVERFTPHDLRHYAASVLIDNGASVKAV
jgi:integrase